MIETYFGVFGGIVFCGVFLGLLFLVSLALFIYYKQLTEGYEDVHRFTILRRVGFTDEEIQKTVKKQVLTVFMLPVVVASIHAVFAFPMIQILFESVYLDKINVLIGYGVTLLLFVIVYIVMYAYTSKTYYQIVTGTKE